MKSKAEIKIFVKGKLSSSPVWALKALVEIYKLQTADEQEHDATEEKNGVGFSGTDAEFLSSLAKQYLQKGRLSDRQLEFLMKKMPKYWNQIVRLSDQAKLESLIPSK